MQRREFLKSGMLAGGAAVLAGTAAQAAGTEQQQPFHLILKLVAQNRPDHDR